MGMFETANVADYKIRQGDTEQIQFSLKGFNLGIYTVKFKGICQNGTIEKVSPAGGISVAAFDTPNNKNDFTINISPEDTKDLKGNIDYEIQISEGGNIHTIIEGRLIMKSEIIKN